MAFTFRLEGKHNLGSWYLLILLHKDRDLAISNHACNYKPLPQILCQNNSLKKNTGS